MRPTLHRGLVILVAVIVIACICLGEHSTPSNAIALAANTPTPKTTDRRATRPPHRANHYHSTSNRATAPRERQILAAAPKQLT